jgi:hypothetical protein
MPEPSPRRRRVLGRLAAVFGVGLLLSVLPLPTVVFTTEMVGATEDLPTTTTLPPTEAEAARAAADEPLADEPVLATADGTREFSAIGLTFDRAPSAPVLVRVREGSGEWGEWQELHLEGEGGPDAGTDEAARSRPGTEPMWVDSSDGYQVTLAAEDVEHAQVVTVHEERHRTTADATPVADAASLAPPVGINTRASWGARAPRAGADYAATIRLAVVHHSDSSNSYTQADVPGILRSIQAFHMDGRGWNDIAYNFVVDKFGTVWEGRGGGIDRPVIGAHAQGFNTSTVGVMVIGDYTQAQPSAAAVESVSKVIGWKLALHDVDPNSRVAFTSGGSNKYPAGTVVNLPRVVGHQDVVATSCPGSIQGHLGTIRARSQQWTDWIRATSGPQGNLDRIVPGNGGITVIGWALDLDTDGPVTVMIVVDGVVRTALADQRRDDVAAAYPAAGPYHGFWVDIGGLSPGWHDVCVLAINRGYGQDSSLGCSGAAVPEPSGRSPVGAIDSIAAIPGGIDVSGWATDADAASLPVQLLVDGEWRRTLWTSSGGRFSARLLGIKSGYRNVCGIGVNQGPGMNLKFACASVGVPGADPRGGLDSLTASGRNIVSSGWAYDPETLDPIEVVLIIDGRWYPVWANRPRAGWDRLYPGYGDVHGYAVAVPVAKGTHRACVAALNVGGGSDNVMRCENIVVK